MQPAQGNPTTESSAGQSNPFGVQFECLDPLLAENESRIQFKQGVLRDYGLVWVKQGELHGTQQNRGIFLTFCVLWKATLTLPDKLPQSPVHWLLWPAPCLCLESWCTASPSALLQQPCILCWTKRKGDDGTVCIYSALTLHTVSTVLASQLASKNDYFMKICTVKQVQALWIFTVCLPLIVTLFWSCTTGRGMRSLFWVTAHRATVHIWWFSPSKRTGINFCSWCPQMNSKPQRARRYQFYKHLPRPNIS